MDPTSPNRQSQHPHFKQSSCQYKSKAFNRNRSVMRLQQPAHSRIPLLVRLLLLLLVPFALAPPLKSSVVFWFDNTVTVTKYKEIKLEKRERKKHEKKASKAKVIFVRGKYNEQTAAILSLSLSLSKVGRGREKQ